MQLLRCSLILLAAWFIYGAESTSCPAAERDQSNVRYHIMVSEETYPQNSPLDTVYSIIGAAKASNVRYILAQLVWPHDVDNKLHGDMKAFEALAAQSSEKKQALLVKQLNKHIDHGQWTKDTNTFWSQVEGAPDLSLERRDNRWYMHNVAVPVPSQRVTRAPRGRTSR